MAQLAFTEEEYRARVARAQRAMAERGLDLVLLHSPENICYLTGYQTSGYFAYQVLALPGRGEPRLLIRLAERGNVDEYSWLREAATWRDDEDVVDATVRLVASLGEHRASIGVEKRCWFLTVDRYEALRERLAPRALVDASGLVDRVRLIKSEAEIARIRRAAALAEVGMRAAMETARDGASELDVAAAIHAAEIRAGCEYTGIPHHLQSGYRSGVGHANWCPKPIRRGELVRLELYGCVARYHATVMRTLCVGEPSDEARRVADALLTAQNAALEALRPGASAREVDARVRLPIRGSGLRPDYYNRTGYSIGIGFPPRSGEWETLDFNEDADWEVQAGMTFHMLAAARGVGFSETVVVTSNGAERLTATLPRDLIVVG